MVNPECEYCDSRGCTIEIDGKGDICNCQCHNEDLDDTTEILSDALLNALEGVDGQCCESCDGLRRALNIIRDDGFVSLVLGKQEALLVRRASAVTGESLAEFMARCAVDEADGVAHQHAESGDGFETGDAAARAADAADAAGVARAAADAAARAAARAADVARAAARAADAARAAARAAAADDVADGVAHQHAESGDGFEPEID